MTNTTNLSERSNKPRLWVPVDEASILVDLEVPARHPCADVQPQILVREPNPVVVVELRDDGNYVNGRKVELRLAPCQTGGDADGSLIHRQLWDVHALHPNILDALFENQQLIHESWKMPVEDKARFVCFRGVQFQSTLPGNARWTWYIRLLCWEQGRWVRSYRTRNSLWNSRYFAAVLSG